MPITKLNAGMDTHIIRDGVEKTAAYTVVVNTDAGKTFYIGSGNSVVFTLPSIAVGNTYTFVNNNKDGQGLLTISPAALDGIGFKGSATDNKDLINTLATAKEGDSVTLASIDQVVSWQVTQASGVWAKEA